MPGESPPEVNIPIVFIFAIICYIFISVQRYKEGHSIQNKRDYFSRCRCLKIYNNKDENYTTNH
jgi:hypothetical protein